MLEPGQWSWGLVRVLLVVAIVWVMIWVAFLGLLFLGVSCVIALVEMMASGL